MDNPPTPARRDAWRSRSRRLRAAVRRAVPFTSGVLAALVALLLYNTLFPAQRPLTTTDLAEVARMLGATPCPDAARAAALLAGKDEV